MTEKWKALPRKYCEVCKCWFGDNKASIAHHESGKHHKNNVVKYLKEVRIRSAKQNEEEKLARKFFSNVEATALRSYRKDIQSGVAKLDSKSNSVPKPSATLDKQPDYLQTHDTTEEPSYSPAPVPIHKAGRKKRSSNLNSIPPAKKIKPEPGYFPPNPYGKWVPVEDQLIKKESEKQVQPQEQQQQQQPQAQPQQQQQQQQQQQPQPQQEQPIEPLQFTERTIDSTFPTQNINNIEFHQPTGFKTKKRNFRRATDYD